MTDARDLVFPDALPLKLRFGPRDLFWAWLVATVFSGLPSTLHAFAIGADPMQATHAAGAMLLPAATDKLTLVAAAFLVHPAVSAFWTFVFGALLPRRHVVAWAIAGAAAVGAVDLLVVAPIMFSEVAALPFWPQFADHLAWGALLGATLHFRGKRAGQP